MFDSNFLWFVGSVNCADMLQDVGQCSKRESGGICSVSVRREPQSPQQTNAVSFVRVSKRKLMCAFHLNVHMRLTLSISEAYMVCALDLNSRLALKQLP